MVILIAQIQFSAYFLILFLFLKDKKRLLSFYLILWGISIVFVVFKDFQFIILENIFKFLANLSFISEKFIMYSEFHHVFLDIGKTNLQLIIKNVLLLVMTSGGILTMMRCIMHGKTLCMDHQKSVFTEEPMRWQ